MDSRTSEKARTEWFGKSPRQVNFYHLGVLLISFAAPIVLCMVSYSKVVWKQLLLFYSLALISCPPCVWEVYAIDIN